LPGREKLALSTVSGIRLELNWCRAKKFLALTAEIEHNSLKGILKSTLLTGVLYAHGNGE